MGRETCLESLEARVLLFAADFDSTFNGTGRATTPLTSVVDVAVQTDGKVLAAGNLGAQFAIARYKTDGKLDLSFGGGDGVATTGFTDPHSNQAATLMAIAILPDGKFIAAGQAGYQLVVARFKSDGTPDTTFGPGGKIASDFFTDLPGVADLAVDSAGAVISAGTLGDDDGTWDVLTVGGQQFQIDRAPDDFEVIGRHDIATGLTIGPDGRIIVVGNDAALGGFVGRLNPDLTLDPTFGPIGVDFAGWVVLGNSFTPSSAAVLPNGRILVGGEGDAGVVRLTGDGKLDLTFGGGDGKAAADFSVADMALQADNRLVIVGSNHNGTVRFDRVRRLNYDGTADTSFDGGDGQVSAMTTRTDAVALGAGGKIIVGGQKSVGVLKGSTPPTDTITVKGTANADTINISQSGSTLTVKINNVTSTVNTTGKTRLVVNGGAGDDTLALANNVTINGLIYGGRGRDRIHAGGGKDEIFGGGETDTVDYSDATVALSVSLNDLADDGPAKNDNVHSDVENVLGGSANDTILGGVVANLFVGNGGADTLRGFGGRDVLIGGKGGDTLAGLAGDDLLIGASTVYDANLSFLLTIGFEWRNTANSYATRVSRLLAGVQGAKISAANVPNDLAVDTLLGGSEQDWFVYHTGDTLSDKVSGETATKLS